MVPSNYVQSRGVLGSRCRMRRCKAVQIRPSRPMGARACSRACACAWRALARGVRSRAPGSLVGWKPGGHASHTRMQNGPGDARRRARWRRRHAPSFAGPRPLPCRSPAGGGAQAAQDAGERAGGPARRGGCGTGSRRRRRGPRLLSGLLSWARRRWPLVHGPGMRGGPLPGRALESQEPLEFAPNRPRRKCRSRQS